MSTHIYKKPFVIFILATLSCFLWGSAFPALKYSYNLLNINAGGYAVKIQFAGYRFFLAGLYILAFICVLKRPLFLPKKAVGLLLILAFVQTSMQYFFFYNGLANTTGVKGSIMMSLGTFFSVVLPHFFYAHEKMNLRKILGLLLGFCGVVYINLAKGPLTGGFSFQGEGFLILSALCGAASSIIAKELSQKMDTLVMTCYQMLIGATFMILFSWVKLGGNVISFSGPSIPLFLYLALISSAGFSLWFTLLSHNNISEISIYKFQIPIWGAVLSALFLVNESLTKNTLLSLILVSAGILFVNLPKKFTLSKRKTL